MKVTINGEPRELPGPTSVTALLEILGYTGRRVAVEINYTIVPRSTYATHQVVEGDAIEIVQAIGGG
jgi:thiamine biosynthesis protein ThiS